VQAESVETSIIVVYLDGGVTFVPSSNDRTTVFLCLTVRMKLFYYIFFRVKHNEATLSCI
jgi:hypothetical protein